LASLVVSDTSPIRALAHLNQLGLLTRLFGQVLVPPAVELELASPPAGLPKVNVRTLPGLEVRAPQSRQRVLEFMQTLDPGESEALALAIEVHADALLIDEAAGRAAAQEVGLRPIGVLGILLRAKQRNLIPELRPLLDQLQTDIVFFISAALRAEILRLAGEMPP